MTVTERFATSRYYCLMPVHARGGLTLTAVPGYRDLIDELSVEFPLGQPIIGEQKHKDFIKLYGNILRLKNILCLSA